MRFLNKFLRIPVCLLIWVLIPISCKNNGKKNSDSMETQYQKGSYGYDITFFKKNNIKTIELKDSLSGAGILIVPQYQGRVMTSTSAGNRGKSYGWINYLLIESGILNPQFNPFGGEERLWLGPEGGPFSVYFRKGDDQVFTNWKVPAELDTVAFDIVATGKDFAEFRKDFSIINASGNAMQIGIERNVRLLSRLKTEEAIGVQLDDSVSFVAYESENTLKNMGTNEWIPSTGFLSIWMLAMFNPSEEGIVFIPFKPGSESELGKIVSDDYFGKVPPDRLIVKDRVLFFKTDGKYRSKIGISPKRALPFCGSYDPVAGILTLLWYSAPEKPALYVNSKWGNQDDPLKGDAVNSYNDGPVEDGSVMGPFYEIESSSPAAFLTPGDKLTHIQRIFHLSGEPAKLSIVTEKLFNISIEEIELIFKNQI
jgi:hypothetical protein